MLEHLHIKVEIGWYPRQLTTPIWKTFGPIYLTQSLSLYVITPDMSFTVLIYSILHHKHTKFTSYPSAIMALQRLLFSFSDSLVAQGDDCCQRKYSGTHAVTHILFQQKYAAVDLWNPETTIIRLSISKILILQEKKKNGKTFLETSLQIHRKTWISLLKCINDTEKPV